MSLQYHATEITYLLIAEAYQIVSIKVKLWICLVLSGKALEDCEEEQLIRNKYIQLVFGTDSSFTIQEGTFSKKGILGIFVNLCTILRRRPFLKWASWAYSA